MKTFKVDTSSWHYKAALWYANDNAYRVPTDFCSYWRSVVAATAIWAVIATMAIVLVGMIGWMLFHVAALIWYREFTENRALSAVAVVIMVFGYAVVTWAEKMANLERCAPKKDTSSSFIRQAYNSWKGKYCMQVEFVSKEQAND